MLVCENNGYGEYTPFEAVTAGGIRARAEVMEVPGGDGRRHERLDGARGGRRARSSTRAPATGPCFVEAITYRFVGHSRSDPGAYRPEGELDAGGRATRSSCCARSSRRRASTRRRSTRSSARSRAELEQMRERGLAAPFPSRARRARVQGLRARELTMPKLSDSMADAVIVTLAEVARARRSRAASRWPRSRPTRRRSSTRRRATACSRRSSSPRAAGARRAADRDARRRRRRAARPARPRRRRLASARQPADDARRPDATPVARRRRSSSASRSTGSPAPGPGGRITRDDVERAAGDRRAGRAPPAASDGARSTVVELTPTQATIARRMAQSARRSRRSPSRVDVDMSRSSRCSRERTPATTAPS